MDPRPPAIKAPPMWARWALAIVVAVALIASLVIALHRAGPENGTSEAAAEAEVNRLTDVAISEDETPHSAGLPSGADPAVALKSAIAKDVDQRIADGQLTGPLQSITCAGSGSGGAARVAYRCTVRSADIAYPFVAVLDERRQQLTWCKVDPPPVAGGPEVRVSASCQA